jgi:molybdopterin-guanine dinucleotide biosynthesis protein A
MVIAVADALWEAGCNPVECQGGDVAALAALGVHATPDREAAAGPVAAIADASSRLGGPIVVAACDLPNLDAASVVAVIAAGEDAGRIAVATASGRHHLLLYVPAATIVGIGAEASVTEALRSLGASEVPVDPGVIRNVNTPDDADSADVDPGAVRRDPGR